MDIERLLIYHQARPKDFFPLICVVKLVQKDKKLYWKVKKFLENDELRDKRGNIVRSKEGNPLVLGWRKSLRRDEYRFYKRIYRKVEPKKIREPKGKYWQIDLDDLIGFREKDWGSIL